MRGPHPSFVTRAQRHVDDRRRRPHAHRLLVQRDLAAARPRASGRRRRDRGAGAAAAPRTSRRRCTRSRSPSCCSSACPARERIRFANSGSEAVMMAVRFARAFRAARRRERTQIVKFEGSYHGSYDDVSWSVSPKLSEVGAHDAPHAVAETRGPRRHRRSRRRAAVQRRRGRCAATSKRTTTRSPRCWSSRWRTASAC